MRAGEAPSEAANGTLRRLTLTVLVDNRVEARGLCAEHGLSILLQAEGDFGEHRLLFDTGQSGGVLLHNLRALRVDPGGVRDVVLSHGHYDHTGGLEAFLAEGMHPPPRVVCHPRLWGGRMRSRPRRRGIGSGLDPAKLRAAGVELVEAEGPFSLRPGLRTTGGIAPRAAWEKPEGFLREERGMRVEDEIEDDLGLVADLGQGGLVLLTGCCHAGLAGLLSQLRRQYGARRIAGIVGGLHLRGVSENRLERTIAALAREAPSRIYPLHCTGVAEACRLRGALGESVRFAAVGDQIRFPA
ncbi:MAG: MBL fold metallo-hydrolase [Desulfobacterales bacterium]